MTGININIPVRITRAINPPHSNPQHSNTNNLNNTSHQHYSTNNSIHQHYNSNQQHFNFNQQESVPELQLSPLDDGSQCLTADDWNQHQYPSANKH